jgi:hypothetical protein
MKKGKTSQINDFESVKCIYGTVDSKNLKSIYIIIQGWIEPITEIENSNRLVSILERQIKHTVLSSIDYTTFKKTTIVDLDLRSSGIQKGKRSFLNLEINLYLTNHIDFKSFMLKDKVKKIINDVYNDNLLKSKYFTLHLTKNKEFNTIYN